MTLKAFSKLPLGVYRIYWKSGGSSLAAIGNDEQGHRWLAPCNWLSPMTATDNFYKKSIRGIAGAVLLKCREIGTVRI